MVSFALPAAVADGTAAEPSVTPGEYSRRRGGPIRTPTAPYLYHTASGESEAISDPEEFLSPLEALAAEQEYKEWRRRVCRNRWQLYWMLYKNPVLQGFRYHALEVMLAKRADEKEVAKKEKQVTDVHTAVFDVGLKATNLGVNLASIVTLATVKATAEVAGAGVKIAGQGVDTGLKKVGVDASSGLKKLGLDALIKPDADEQTFAREQSRQRKWNALKKMGMVKGAAPPIPRPSATGPEASLPMNRWARAARARALARQRRAGRRAADARGGALGPRGPCHARRSREQGRPGGPGDGVCVGGHRMK